jgi:hypothetical protein
MTLRSKVKINIQMEIVNKDTRNELQAIVLHLETYMNANGYTITGSSENKVRGSGRIDGLYTVNGESDDENE